LTLARLRGVPVFVYHRIVAATECTGALGRFDVRESEFHAQMQIIRELGISVVAPLDIALAQAPAVSVSLTFDDGFSSAYQIALPLLSELGLNATFFLTTSNIGKRGFLEWEMAAEMSRAGMRFGAHANTHVVLTTLNRQRLRDELRLSRQMLEDRLYCIVDELAVPYGFWNHNVLAEAWESGYRVVCTAKPWPAQKGERLVTRTAVLEHTSLSEFHKLLNNNPAEYLRRWARERGLAIPKLVLLRLYPNLLGVRVSKDRQ